MSEKRKIMAGNRARKKLNARDCARVLMAPRWIPVKKKSATSYTGKWSKPGNATFFV